MLYCKPIMIPMPNINIRNLYKGITVFVFNKFGPYRISDFKKKVK